MKTVALVHHPGGRAGHFRLYHDLVRDRYSRDPVSPCPVFPIPGDCFSLVNESAHSANTGSSQQITVNGYVSNICSTPLGGLTVRGISTGRTAGSSRPATPT